MMELKDAKEGDHVLVRGEIGKFEHGKVNVWIGTTYAFGVELDRITALYPQFKEGDRVREVSDPKKRVYIVIATYKDSVWARAEDPNSKPGQAYTFRASGLERAPEDQTMRAAYKAAIEEAPSDPPDPGWMRLQEDDGDGD